MRKMSILQNLLDVLNPVRTNKREIRAKLDSRPQLRPDEFAQTYFPKEKQGVAKRLMEITESYCDTNVVGLVPEDEFVADLKIGDLDCLEIVELVLQAEEEFDVTILDQKKESLRTFSELVDEIVLLQNEKI